MNTISSLLSGRILNPKDGLVQWRRSEG